MFRRSFYSPTGVGEHGCHCCHQFLKKGSRLGRPCLPRSGRCVPGTTQAESLVAYLKPTPSFLGEPFGEGSPRLIQLQGTGGGGGLPVCFGRGWPCLRDSQGVHLCSTKTHSETRGAAFKAPQGTGFSFSGKAEGVLFPTSSRDSLVSQDGSIFILDSLIHRSPLVPAPFPSSQASGPTARLPAFQQSNLPSVVEEWPASHPRGPLWSWL